MPLSFVLGGGRQPLIHMEFKRFSESRSRVRENSVELPHIQGGANSDEFGSVNSETAPNLVVWAKYPNPGALRNNPRDSFWTHEPSGPDPLAGSVVLTGSFRRRDISVTSRGIDQPTQLAMLNRVATVPFTSQESAQPERQCNRAFLLQFGEPIFAF